MKKLILILIFLLCYSTLFALNLSWTDSPNAKSYTLHAIDPNGTDIIILTNITVSNKKYTIDIADTGLYSFYVVTITTDGASIPSNKVTTWIEPKEDFNMELNFK